MFIDKKEITSFVQLIRSQPEYLEPEWVLNIYKSHNVRVFADPFSASFIDPIKQALIKKTPFSVVRVGDGESNILTYAIYPDTPSLDKHVFQKIVSRHKNSFIVDPTWMLVLRDMFMSSLSQADIVGVIGLWRPNKPTIESVINRFLLHHRGICGHWRAISYMIELASKGYFKNVTIASAHLYFSILENLHTILPLADSIMIISDDTHITHSLARKYPYLSITHIPVAHVNTTPLPNKPFFLSTIYAALPINMEGILALIGAGPWAEIYCGWIKQRGGVAIDIGSGVDLLDGKLTRPIHKKINREIIKNYKL